MALKNFLEDMKVDTAFKDFKLSTIQELFKNVSPYIDKVLEMHSKEIDEKERVRASAERLGIDTAGMDTSEIKNAMLDKLSNE